MRYLFLIAAVAAITSCTNADKNADGTPLDSAAKARRDSLANLTRPTPADLNTSVQNFLAYNKSMQFDSVANYIYPTVYKYIPKSQVIQGLSIIKILQGIELRMDSANVVRMDSVSRFSSGEATRLDYVLKISAAIQDTGVGKQVTPQVRNMIIGALQSSLGAQNVLYNESTRTITATIQRQALAISDTVSQGWKFVALENNNQLRQILPAEVADKYLGGNQPMPADSLKRNDTSRKAGRIE